MQSEASWAARARMKGALRYYGVTFGRMLALWLAILAGAQVLSLLWPMMGQGRYEYIGATFELGWSLIAALVYAQIAAGRGTRFVLRFGTPRLSAWMSAVVSLWASCLAFLLCAFVLDVLLGLLTGLLAQAMPGSYSVWDGAMKSLVNGLPSAVLYVLEWSCVFYLLCCCMRRNKALTLIVIIGVPAVLMMLTLVPAVNEAVRVVEQGSETEIMVYGLQWVGVLQRIWDFVTHQWQWIQLGAAVASLPLSYLCMRGTAQP